MSVVSVASVNKFFMSVDFSKILRTVDDVTQVEVVNDLMGCSSLPLPTPMIFATSDQLLTRGIFIW